MVLWVPVNSIVPFDTSLNYPRPEIGHDLSAPYHTLADVILYRSRRGPGVGPSRVNVTFTTYLLVPRRVPGCSIEEVVD